MVLRCWPLFEYFQLAVGELAMSRFVGFWGLCSASLFSHSLPVSPNVMLAVFAKVEQISEFCKMRARPFYPIEDSLSCSGAIFAISCSELVAFGVCQRPSF